MSSEASLKMTVSLKITAGFWAQSCAQLLASRKLHDVERDRIIDEMRQIAQAAADAGLVDLVRTEQLREGER